jgi:Protein of unknown function (DUF2946)
MDDLVQAAMRKWPNVPDCYGWLALDARGNWWMRDAEAQLLGPFATENSKTTNPKAKGALLVHQKLIEFIGRNYLCNQSGCWYFQNGPQRVFVELEACPWVLRVAQNGETTTHTGVPVQITQAWIDELGRVYLSTPLGLGLVHTLDMEYAANQIEKQAWTLGDVTTAELPERFGFVRSPKQA